MNVRLAGWPRGRMLSTSSIGPSTTRSLAGVRAGCSLTSARRVQTFSR